jgi:hypothetical protein
MHVSPAAYCISILMLLSAPAFSQRLLTGRVHPGSGAEVIPSVSVINRTQKKTNISDIGGNYRIPANPGDTVIFSSAGYKSDTAFVSTWMFEEKDGYQVYLEPNLVMLPTFRVGQLSNYQLDSVKRKEEYAWLYPVHPRTLAGNETAQYGFGIVLSPVDYFSAKETRRRKLRRRLGEQEKDYYIDSRFPPPYVVAVTGLRSDSLKTFLVRYRPSYDFCRKARNEDIFLYINESVKKYRQHS